LDLIPRFPSIEEIVIEDEKGREEKYKQTFHSNNCSEWVRIIKTLSPRMEARALQKKTVDQIDQRYFRMAEDLLYGKLTFSLGIPKDQVRDSIADQVALLAWRHSCFARYFLGKASSNMGLRQFFFALTNLTLF